MERSPSISILFHIRVISLAILLASVDMLSISHAFHSTVTKGPSVQLVFGFEYAILLTIVINTVVKYVLNSIDLHSENPWEGKAVCLLYSELILGFVKVDLSFHLIKFSVLQKIRNCRFSSKGSLICFLISITYYKFDICYTKFK